MHRALARREVVPQPRRLVGAARCTCAREAAVPVEHDDVPGPEVVARTTCARPGGRAAHVRLERRAAIRVDIVVAHDREPDPVLHRAPRAAEAIVELRCRPVLVGGVAERGDHAGQSRHERPRLIVVGRVAATDVAGRQEHRRRTSPSPALGPGRRLARGGSSRPAGGPCGRRRSGPARLRGEAGVGDADGPRSSRGPAAATRTPRAPARRGRGSSVRAWPCVPSWLVPRRAGPEDRVICGRPRPAPRARIRSIARQGRMRDNARGRSGPSCTTCCPAIGVGGRRLAMGDAPYRRIHVVVNPASGKDEPVLNVLNDVFHRHGVDWNVSITKKYGDAAAQAKAALADGVDLVVGYGGDGTQHELANAVLEVADAVGRPRADRDPARRDRQRLRAGDGRAGTLREATEVLCQSDRLRRSTSAGSGRGRECRRPGPVLHPAAVRRGRARGADESRDEGPLRRVRLCRQPGSPRAGQGGLLPCRGGRRALRVPCLQGLCRELGDDGHRPADHPRVFRGRRAARRLRDRRPHADTIVAAASRFLDLHTASASRYHRQCRTLRIETTPDQPIWADGEYIGRTPVSIEVSPRALSVVVP